MKMKIYNPSDLEEQITACWNILNEIKSLEEAVLETEITKDQASNILLGLKDLYQIKFNKLSMMMNNCIVDSEFEQLMINCWQIVDDIYLIAESIDDDTEREIKKDHISNILMGARYLYELKFNKLWNYYISKIIKT